MQQPPPTDAELEASRLAFGAVWTAVGLGLVPFALVLARKVVPERRVFFARWGFTHLAVAFATAVVAAVVVGLAWPHDPAVEVGVLEALARTTLMYVAVAALIARLAWRLEPAPAAALGFERGGNLRAVLLGLALYVVLLPGLMGVTTLWPEVLRRLGEPIELQEILLGVLELRGAPLVLALLGGIVVIPFFEELVFRGFLQPLLVQNFRDRGGVVLTSIVFAALHGTTAFLPIFALSLILGGVMLRTRRLASSWAVHALHNGLMFLLAFNVPEMRELGGEHALLGLFLP